MWPGPGLRHKLEHAGASPRSAQGPRAFTEEVRKAQSVKRIAFSLQMSKVSASLLPPPSKVAATETVQPFSFGSLTVARPLGASGFESLVFFSPAVMTIPVAVFAVALMIVTEEGGSFRFGFCFGFCFCFCFGAAVSGVAAASPGTEPGTVGVCAEMAVTLARKAAQASPAIRG